MELCRVKWEMFSTVCWPNVDQVAPASLKKFMIIKSSYSRQYSEQLPDWEKYRFSEAIWKYFKRNKVQIMEQTVAFRFC